jgi:hypothetical protein
MPEPTITGSVKCKKKVGIKNKKIRIILRPTIKSSLQFGLKRHVPESSILKGTIKLMTPVRRSVILTVTKMR